MWVGTSGWAYREWVGPFYPEGTPATRFLASYAERLATVEAHSTYRRLPRATTLERWCAHTGDDFRFAPKAHLGITHRRDLDGVEERVAAFFAALAALRDRLGPTLFQLPHRAVDLDRLDRLLGALPVDARAAEQREQHGLGLAIPVADGHAGRILPDFDHLRVQRLSSADAVTKDFIFLFVESRRPMQRP